jgi:uncharacterized protein (DUF1697 family)
MALVVFLRGVNVGGHRTFQPAALAKELAAFEVVNIGAAGTFVVRKKVGQARLRAEFLQRLRFEPELMICRAREVLALAAGDPFPDDNCPDDVSRYVSVMAKRPKTLPDLPIRQPDGDDWQVKVVAVSGPFALSLHRRQGRTLVYPNEVVEKRFGMSVTTRNWNTIAAICDILTRS